MPTVKVSFVVVTYNSRRVLEHALVPLGKQLGPGDEVIVVDNDSADGTAEFVAERWPDARLVQGERNLGFAAACNVGAAQAHGDLIVFLNPDAAPAPDFLEAIRGPYEELPEWGAWMPLVTMDGGARVNTSGGVVHFSGVSWAGEVGLPVESTSSTPHEVGFVSGACFAIRAELWREQGGFPPEYFMYCEDLDLSLRLRLSGWACGIYPTARVDHDYEFTKAPAKWRFLERNRIATIVRTYPASLLLAVAPVLLATELALHALALVSGWGRQKLLADLDILRALPRLLRERRAIQERRTISTSLFAAHMTSDLSSPYLGRPAEWSWLRTLLRTYWRAATKLLR